MSSDLMGLRDEDLTPEERAQRDLLRRRAGDGERCFAEGANVGHEEPAQERHDHLEAEENKTSQGRRSDDG